MTIMEGVACWNSLISTQALLRRTHKSLNSQLFGHRHCLVKLSYYYQQRLLVFKMTNGCFITRNFYFVCARKILLTNRKLTFYLHSTIRPTKILLQKTVKHLSGLQSLNVYKNASKLIPTRFCKF